MVLDFRRDYAWTPAFAGVTMHFRSYGQHLHSIVQRLIALFDKQKAKKLSAILQPLVGEFASWIETLAKFCSNP
jgi:hypothetical protein